MREVHHHAAVVVIESQMSRRFLFAGYDDGYPVTVFRNAINLLGGNHESCDRSPYDTLIREVNEELTIIGEREKYAPEALIDSIREKIHESTKPIADFIVTDPPVRPGRKINDAIFSFYGARVDDYLLDEASKWLSEGKRITTEGFIRIVGLDEIVSGSIPMAWGTPPLMKEYLGKEVPNSHNVQAIKIGMPRSSFSDYLGEFIYSIPVLGQNTK